MGHATTGTGVLGWVTRGSCSAIGFQRQTPVSERGLFAVSSLPQGTPLTTWGLASAGLKGTFGPPDLVSVLGSPVYLGLRAGTLWASHPAARISQAPLHRGACPPSAGGSRVLLYCSRLPNPRGSRSWSERCRSRWILLLPFAERPRGRAGLLQFPLASGSCFWMGAGLGV